MSVAPERRSVQTRRTLFAICLGLGLMLAAFFHTQVVNGAGYRTISDASRAHADGK